MVHVTKAGIRDEFHMTYNLALEGLPWMQFVNEVDVNDPNGLTETRTMGLRGMEERSGMPNFAATIPSKDYKWYTREWSDGFAVTRDEWNFDKVSAVTTKINELATIAASAPGELVESLMAALLDDVGSGAILDPFFSVAFIGTTHPANLPGSRASTWSNYLTSSEVSALNVGTPGALTDAEWEAVIFGIITYMQTMTGEGGRKLWTGVRSINIACGTGNYPELVRFLNKSVTAAGTNPVYGTGGQNIGVTATLLPSSTSTTQLLITPSNLPRKPMGLQFLQRPGRDSMTILGPESEHFQKEKYAPVWVEGRYNAAYLWPEMILGALLS